MFRLVWHTFEFCRCSWQSSDRHSSASSGPRRQRSTWCQLLSEKMTTLVCISADIKTSQHVCLFPSTLNSPLTPFKNWFVWVTSANLRRHFGKTSCKAVSFKSAYFHLISHQCEMGSYEKVHFTVRWIGVFKKNTLIDALHEFPPISSKKSALTTIRWPALFQDACMKGHWDQSKRIYLFMVSVCF